MTLAQSSEYQTSHRDLGHEFVLDLPSPPIQFTVVT